MKKILITLMIAILLPASAFSASKKKQPAQPDSTQPEQDGTDWLNAPTPDGSPTLKETSDWLAKTFADFGSDRSDSLVTVVSGVRIDNGCRLYYTKTTTDIQDRKYLKVEDVSVPLGAIRSIIRVPDDNERATAIEYRTGRVALVHLSVQGHGIGFVKADAGQYDSDLEPNLPLNGTPPTRPGVEIHYSYEMLPRVIKALQHAASLCQSAYKVPAQSKEPF